ncbi:GNAT family N-acetyltransferase [Salsipaludibacter albus]|uniref:GNAT family N-acetyltransferase n=1 Tax=Salsipaludibacter albus TaxID=2849650 RepID=UPI001EE3E458|nr:GNAT family N-acetyltransferase [Salsipaludibacter albus]MBY5161164.1 GNAT family N-acetyltransferase [Salsipaludibacter albus]
MTTSTTPDGLALHDAALTDLPVPRVYELLALRVDVFVVEQACAYPELDGRDLEDGARHVFLVEPDGDRVVAALRRLDDRVDDHPVTRVGRVVTHADHRGAGLAGWLLDHVVAGEQRAIVLDAQEHLVDFYARSGFRVTGPGWLEDGIPHVPMRRDPEDA